MGGRREVKINLNILRYWMENTLFETCLSLTMRKVLLAPLKPYLLPSEHNYVTAYAKDLGKRRTEAIIYI